MGGDRDRPPDRLTRREIGEVTVAERAALLGQRPVTVWLTGLSGSGKSTLARALERALHERGRACFVLDGDDLRRGLSRDLGFSPEHRHENIRRAAEVAGLMNDAGLIVVTAFISPYRADREAARKAIGHERVIETWLSADLPTCEARDPKGLYKLARDGRIAEFTGIGAPYERPIAPQLTLDTGKDPVEACVRQVLDRVLAVQ